MGSIPGLERSPGEKKWQPTPVFLPGKSHGQTSLMGYSLWECKRDGYDLATKQQWKTNTNIISIWIFRQIPIFILRTIFIFVFLSKTIFLAATRCWHQIYVWPPEGREMGSLHELNVSFTLSLLNFIPILEERKISFPFSSLGNWASELISNLFRSSS